MQFIVNVQQFFMELLNISLPFFLPSCLLVTPLRGPQADHPGFTDAAYRKRRTDLAALANAHRHGQPLPHVTYTKSEIDTWGEVFRKLTTLYPTHACREYNRVFPLLVGACEGWVTFEILLTRTFLS